MDYDRTKSPLHALMLTGKRYTVPKGQLVGAFNENNMLHFIYQGHIKRYRISNDGEESIQIIYGPGNVIPLSTIYKSVFKIDMYSGPERYFYEAMSTLQIYVISHTKLLEALEANPAIYKDLFYIAGPRLNSFIHGFESLSMRSAHRKVAHQLVFLAEIYGVATEQGIKLSLPITHQDISEILSMARETVSRAMTVLTKKGMLLAGRSIVITDLDQLKVEAEWADEK